jgi:putative ABC transport system permease protein
MRASEIIKMAFGSLGVNRLRSALTMLGITIGVFSVIGVMTAVSALRGSVESGISSLGADIFQFTKWPQGFVGGGVNWRRYAMRTDITLDEGMRYRDLMAGVTDVVSLRVNAGGSRAAYGGQRTNANINLIGTDEHYLAANKYTLEAGRNLLRDDVEFGRPVVVIGRDLVERLFPNESPLERRVTIRGHSYTVVGMLESKGSAFGQTQDGVAIVPITRFMNDLGSRGRSLTIATQAAGQGLYNDTVDRAIGAMRLVRRLVPEDDNDFEISSNDSLIAAFATVADTLQMGSLAISGIALLAAGVGIMNIMFVSVTERTKEIGVRKSLGARKKSILAQFLLEATVLSLTGGVAGILLGVAAGNGLALMLNATIVFPWDWAAIGIAVCSAIGVGFGFYPAWKAASLDPIEALRYE